MFSNAKHTHRLDYFSPTLHNYSLTIVIEQQVASIILETIFLNFKNSQKAVDCERWPWFSNTHIIQT